MLVSLETVCVFYKGRFCTAQSNTYYAIIFLVKLFLTTKLCVKTRRVSLG